MHILTGSGPAEMSRHMPERTTVRLPEDLLLLAERKAAVEGRTLTSLIDEGLRLVTAETRQPVKKRVLPPISKAKGGLRPESISPATPPSRNWTTLSIWSA